MLTDFDKDLLAYFTDVEHLRGAFKQAIAAAELPNRLFVLWGIGGVGKSSLLRMFRLYCKETGVPVALASGDEAKSVLEVLARWMDDLKAAGVALPSLGRSLESYRTLLAKAESAAGEIAGKMVKGAAKAATETVLSTVPGFGLLLAKLGSTGVDVLTDALLSRGFKKPDIDLLLNPASKLTDAFLADVAQAADDQRLVLMLDTFEQMPGLENWTRSLAQRLHKNVLLVIAGRGLPDWSRAWPDWLAKAQIAELKPMTDDVMRDLVRRYYATMRGGEPDPQQIEAIIQFARGLPIVVTSVVQLWVKYPERMGDLKAISPEVMADLVERLIEGVPQEMLPVLEAAAAVRWFDQPMLRAVTGLADVRELYNELRRFPFVRPRAEGLALHDAVREIIDANLHAQDPDRHCELHERAATYFERRLEKATGEEAERLGLERLYHRVLADEETGIKLFQEMAEELTRYRLVNRLRVLLNDVNTYPLERESSQLWRLYYGAGLARKELRATDAEQTYQMIAESKHAEPKLRAYALCDHGDLLSNPERLGQHNGVNTAIGVLELSQRLAPMDLHLVSTFDHLHNIQIFNCELQKALTHLEGQRKWLEENGSKHRVIRTYCTLQENHGLIGDWHQVMALRALALKELDQLPENLFLRYQILGGSSWALVCTGRFHETENATRMAMSLARQFHDMEMVGSWDRDLGYVVGLQGRYEEATKYFAEGLQIRDNRYAGKWERGIALGFWGEVLTRQGNLSQAEEYLVQSLEIKRDLQDTIGIPELLVKYGALEESRFNWSKAESLYHQALDLRWIGRCYFENGALAGLIRVKHAQGDCAAVPPLLAEAERLAQQHEYNDHLSSFRLTQAHSVWEDQTFEVSGNLEGLDAFGAALRYYRQALIYALRYNRFLLDEALSGRPQGTPLRPIIPYCLARGEEGRRMLTALRDWWKTGLNDIVTPRPDTISAIPEGIALLEAERIARDREPGDGSPQASILEQIEKALTKS